MKRFLLALLPVTLMLTACEQVNQRLGLEDPARKEARQDGEGKAVGSACRQSGRAIEDCYAIYYWLPKASIFAGWREMNDYMLSNKLEIVQPRYEPPGSPDEMRKKRRKPAEEETEDVGKNEAEKADSAAAAGKPAEGDKPDTAAKPAPAAKPSAKP